MSGADHTTAPAGPMSGADHTTAPAGGAVAGRPGRRALTYAVLLCLAGAGIVFLAATRTWSVEVTVRPAPLPPVEHPRTGADLLPWLPALALVGLASGGAVLATRGVLRRLLGVLVLAVGLGVAAGAGYALRAAGGPGVGWLWPALCVPGGLLVATAGLLTAWYGHTWPAMGARYDRHRRRAGAVPPGPVDRTRTVAAWDALDRGEDPTAG